MSYEFDYAEAYRQLTCENFKLSREQLEQIEKAVAAICKLVQEVIDVIARIVISFAEALPDLLSTIQSWLEHAECTPAMNGKSQRRPARKIGVSRGPAAVVHRSVYHCRNNC